MNAVETVVGRVTAPWTEDQVASLNGYQQAGYRHHMIAHGRCSFRHASIAAAQARASAGSLSKAAQSCRPGLTRSWPTGVVDESERR